MCNAWSSRDDYEPGDEIFLDPNPLGTLRKRDRADEPAIVQSRTTVWRMQ
jgi:hypothetical protein